MSLFSKNLRFLRKKGGFKQDEIAALFNKRPNTIGNWENEKSEPSLAELVRLGDYFNVSTQDLLHSDMEVGVYNKEGQGAALQATAEQKVKSYPEADPVISMANEEGPDAFWLVLRELRALNTKVDLLVSSLDPTVFRRNSDKSNH